MSKKMMKRSLALGALMAFVITGSAFAESVPTDNNPISQDGYNIIGTGVEDLTVTGLNTGYGYGVDGYGTITGVNNLTVTAVINNALNVLVSTDGTNITANNITLTANNSNGNAIQAYGDLNLTANATNDTNGNMTLSGGNRVIRVVGGADVVLTAENGKITIDGSTASEDAVKVGDNSNTDKKASLTLNANEIEITSAKKGVLGSFNSTTELNANKIVINSNDRAVDAYEVGSNIRINGGKAVTITGGDRTINTSDTGAQITINSVDGNVIVKTSGTDAIKARGEESKIIVTGNNIDIDGGVFVDGISTKAEINMIAVNNLDISRKGDDVIKTWGKDTVVNAKGGNGTTVSGHVIIDSNATGSTINVGDGGDTTIDGDVKTWGNNSTITINGANTTITGDVKTYNESEINLNATNKLTINGVVQALNGNGNDDISLYAKEIEINANGGNALRSANNYAGGASSVVNAGNEKTESVTIKNFYYGISTYYDGAEVNVEGKELVLESSKGFAIAAMSAEGKSSSHAVVNIGEETGTATKINIKTGNGPAVGLYATSQGKINVYGDLYIKADDAIAVRGNSTVNINESKNREVQIDGNINFNKNEDKDSTNNPNVGANANVNINLTTATSYFNGKIFVSNDSGVNNYKESFKDIKNMNITLSNGAKWNLTGESVVNQATFGEDAILILGEGSAFEADFDEDGNALQGGTYALIAGGGNANKLTIDQDAKLQIGGIKETTYNIAQGFANYNDVADKLDIADNALLQAEKVVNDRYYQVEIKAKAPEQMATDTGISTSTAGLVQSIIEGAGNENKTPEQQAAVDFINNVVKNNATSEAVGNAINAATKMAEAGGQSATAAKVVSNVTGVTNQRLSFGGGNHGGHKGGHGVGLFEEGSGAAIWAQYVHGKDSVEDMPSTAGASSYEGQFNGIVMGVDFKKVGKFQSGMAFNYGEGDTNSVGSAARTKSEYDFWGIGYYGNIRNEDTNVIFDVNYAKTDSEVTQNNSGTAFEANPETTTWSAGVKVEKLYQNNNVQIVPYTGLRYMSIDSDDYSTKDGAFNYSMDRQDIWLLPLGVSIRQEVVNDNGWVVTPKVDLSYIWAFGDTNSNMEVKSPFSGVSQVGYDVMDDGSWLGLVGIEAAMDDWTFGVSYSYQKGDHSESKKWYVDAKYSF